MTLKSLREARIERDDYYEYSVKVISHYCTYVINNDDVFQSKAQKRNEKLFSKVKSMNNEISQLAVSC